MKKKVNKIRSPKDIDSELKHLRQSNEWYSDGLDALGRLRFHLGQIMEGSNVIQNGVVTISMHERRYKRMQDDVAKCEKFFTKVEPTFMPLLDIDKFKKSKGY